MRLQDIMSTNIQTIEQTATLSEARDLMRRNRIHHLLVRDGRKIVGIVSDRDLGGRVGARGNEGAVRTVAEVMAAPVVGAAPGTTTRQAANMLRGLGIGCLVVLDEGKPVGLVTTSDLLELIGRGVDRPIERSTRWTLRARGQAGAGPTERHARRG
jgi:acetoin utilization protein AcuB